MNNRQKIEIVDFLQKNLSGNAASFLVGVQGLKVNQLESLRGKLRQGGGTLKIAKGRLVKRALDEVQGGQDLSPYCKNQIGVVFARQEVPAVAKVLYDFSKENEALSIVAGYYETQVLDANSVILIASLPSKDVLRAQLCGTLKMPMVSFANVLNVLLVRLVWALNKVGEKKQE